MGSGFPPTSGQILPTSGSSDCPNLRLSHGVYPGVGEGLVMVWGWGDKCPIAPSFWQLGIQWLVNEGPNRTMAKCAPRMWVCA